MGFFICVYLYDMRFIITEEQSEKLNHKIKSMVEKYGVEYTLKMFDNNTDVIKRVYQENPLEFLNQFNDLTPVENNGKISYKDKNNLTSFYYYPDRINGDVFINYFRIWKFFEDVIGFKYSEIQDIMRNWLEETYNITGLTPHRLGRS